jgi:radical SAM protein with 4Fe4S-binding SPASM domain
MRVLIFTNARLITQRLAKLLSKIPPLKKIEVTTYGMHEESYAKNTQKPGAFKSFQRGVQYLQDYNVPFIVKSVYLPANRGEDNEFKNWAKTITRMDKNPHYTIFLDLRNRNDNKHKNAKIKTLRVSPQESIKILLNNYPQQFNQFKENYWRNITSLPGPRLFRCDAGRHQLTIDAYGRIQPCLGLRAPDLVLHRGTSLKNALITFKSLKNLEALNSDYINRCGKCFLRNLCQQCPAKSWSENGTLDTPIEYYCEITHTLARELGWLDESEYAWEVKDWMVRVSE